jgi:hypothetical protein
MDFSALDSKSPASSNLAGNRLQGTQCDLGLFFNRCVSSVENSASKLTCCREQIGENKPIHSRTIKFQAIRAVFAFFDFINRMFSRSHKNVTIHKKTDLSYAEQPPKKDYEQITVNISDEMLINDLNPEQKKFFVKDETRSIFDESREISPFDVRQSDTRSSCYFLSMLVSFAATNKIRDLLSVGVIEDLGNGKAKVSFVNEHHQIKIDVIIDISQLITNDSDTVYSINELSSTSWASMLEKAHHGLRLFLKNSLLDDSLLEETGLPKENIERLRATIADTMTGVINKAENSLDFGQPDKAASWLPRIPKCEQIADLEQVDEAQRFMLIKDKDQPRPYEKAVQTLFENAKLGIPMNVSSKARTNVFEKIRIGFEGMPSSHSVAVVGAATKEKSNGEKVDGLMIFDQYARPLPSKKLRKAMENGTDIPIDIRNSESCIKFIPLEDLHKYFAESVIVAGGFKIKRDAPSI